MNRPVPPSKRGGTPKASAPARPGRPSATRRPGAERLLYGLHAVRAAWLNPDRRCRRLLLTEAGAESLAPALAEAAAAKLERPPPRAVERAALERALPDGAVHQGVALEVEPLPPVDLDDVRRAAFLRSRAAVVALDQVTDPHNVGAVLRSAAAFGALAVLVTERHAPEITGALAKAASGAVEHVPLLRVTNLARALGALKEDGFTAVGLAEEAAQTLAAAALPAKAVLVLGAEGPGLRRLTRETCDRLARLPTGGPVASLNVSNAAAVALYEHARAAPAVEPRTAPAQT